MAISTQSHSVEIRAALAADWPTIQQLNYQVFVNDAEHDDDLNLDWPFSPAGVEYYQQLTDGSYGQCFIAEIDGQPVGYVALAVKKDFDYRRSKYVEIENIGVKPAFRSQRIGTKLMARAVDWAKEHQATKLYVSAYWENHRAIAFYERHGFYKSGVELDRKL